MLPCYDDILEAAGVPPLWFSGNGVPRFRQFHPDMLGVYDKFALLVRIECQACGIPIDVGNGWMSWSSDGKGGVRTHTLGDLAGGYRYGDPPDHGGCVGETMGSVSVKILQAWEQVKAGPPEWSRWARNPEVEAIDIRQNWAK